MNININININNSDLIEYIKNEKDIDINNFLNIILKLGFSNYEHLNQNSELYNKKSNLHNTILNKIDNVFDHKILPVINNIKDDTYKISNLFNKSCIKGVYGENIIYNIFKQYFSEYCLTNVSNLPHSGDFHLLMNDINETILIENKYYTNTIDQKEINKLYYDMKHTGIKYSILISLSSNIVNKKNDIEWEINNDNIIIFISNVNSNSKNIIIGVMILKELILLKKENKENKYTNIQNFTNNSYNKISEHINDIVILKTNINKIKKMILNIHDNMVKQMLDLYNMIAILDNEFSQKINILQYSITNEFKSINININNTDLDIIYNKINMHKDDNIKKILNTIISDLYSNNYFINDDLTFYKQIDNHIGQILILKKTININIVNLTEFKKVDLVKWNNILKYIKIY